MTLRNIAKQVALQLLFVFILIEVALRVFPSAISPAWLVHFNSNIRSEISEKLGLKMKVDGLLLQRSDGGRPLDLLPPEKKVHVPVDQIDVEHGAVESVVTDQFGFCNPQGIEIPEIDVLAVGDSFTWCTTLPATLAWPAILSDLLGNGVYNAGLSGVGFYEYLELARHILRQVEPTTLVLAIYAGNDLLNARGLKTYRDAMRNGEIDPEVAAMPKFHQRSALGKLYYLVIENSPLGDYSYAVNVFGSLSLFAKHWLLGQNTYQRPELVDIDFRYSIEKRGGQKVAFNPFNLDRNELLGAYQLSRGELDTSLWDEAVERLSRLQRDENLDVVVVLIPSAHIAYNNSSQFVDIYAKRELLRFHQRQSEYLAQQSAQNGWKYRDLAEALAQSVEETDQLLYFPGNLHLTKSGHEVVAREISYLLLSQ